MKRLLALALLLSAGLPSYAAERFCTHSYWVWIANERVKVCCSNSVCTTKYGIYQNN
ncbi:hypothetical protein OAL13_00180 [bacterium]|nr:hypothetical protein [bacterium]